MTEESIPLQAQDFLQGQLLIAMPNLRDGCFDHSVVLICSHDETHAMGLIINRTISDLTFADLLQQLKIDPLPAASKRKVHFGGPVETKRGIVLHSDEYVSEDTVSVCDGIGLTATRKILADMNGISSDVEQPVGGPVQALLCMGHAGWAPGQLESELAQNAWLNLTATPELVFSSKTGKVWDRALAELGVEPAMLSGEWSDVRDPNTPLN